MSRLDEIEAKHRARLLRDQKRGWPVLDADVEKGWLIRRLRLAEAVVEAAEEVRQYPPEDAGGGWTEVTLATTDWDGLCKALDAWRKEE